MAPAIITLTIGGILVISALKGISVLDVISGKQGDTLDPHGGSMGSSVGSTVGDTVGFQSPIPPSKGGKWTAPSGGASSFRGPHAAQLDYLAGIAQNQFHLRITATTNGVHVSDSYHYRGRAFDAAGSESDMAAFDNFVAENFGATTAELIHNPGPVNIKNGSRVNGASVYAAVWAGHRDHVHTAA